MGPYKLTLPTVFAEIWEERDHVSFLTGLPLPEYPVFGNFAHVLNRNVYPKYKYKKENIVPLDYPTEHQLLDHGTEHKRELYAGYVQMRHGVDCNWQKIFDLKEQLRQQYAEELKQGQYMK